VLAGNVFPLARVRQFVPVQMGSETKEADIIVCADVLKSHFRRAPSKTRSREWQKTSMRERGL
jgi:hypothetical protein